MKNLSLFILFASCICLTSCDLEVETIPLKQSDFRQDKPEAYNAYMENLRNYKSSDHVRVYVWFDNSEKTPFNRSHHYTLIPDSVDFVCPTNTDFEQWEIDEMTEIKAEKGTRFFATIDYAAIRAAYDAEMELDPSQTPTTEGFQTYLSVNVASIIEHVDQYPDIYDAIAFAYNGKSQLLMEEKELKDYTETEAIYLSPIKEWLAANPGKELVFIGQPQYLHDKEILKSCATIMLSNTLALSNPNEIDYFMENALQDNVPNDKFSIAVYSPSEDPTDPARLGYTVDGRIVLDIAADWSRKPHDKFKINAIGIRSINRDFFINASKVYYYTRRTIDILNPVLK